MLDTEPFLRTRTFEKRRKLKFMTYEAVASLWRILLDKWDEKDRIANIESTLKKSFLIHNRFKTKPISA